MDSRPPLRFFMHRPRPPLDRFVESMVFYEDHFPDHSKEKMLPDGAIDLIIDLTPAPKRLYHREDFSRFTSFRRSWISGMRRGYIVIEAAAGSSMLVVRFHPGGAYPFLGFPAAELTDLVTELDSVWGSSVHDLRERLLAATTPGERFALVEEELLARAGGCPEVDTAVEHLVARLMDPRDAAISRVVGQVGYSHRHVLALFRRRVGLNPKQFCRIRKFQQVVQRVETDPSPDWSDLALECGYYDQSHFINEFRHFSGLSPTSYLGARGEYVNYLPLD